MVEQTTRLIIVLNILCLIGLIVGLRWWQRKYGKLTEKGLALILTGYLSFSAITTSLPILIISPQVTIIVDLVFLFIFWVIGYPWIRWLYRQFNSSK